MGKVTYEIVKWGDALGYGCEIKETNKGWFKTITKTWTLIPSGIGSTAAHVFSRWTCAETGESMGVEGLFLGEAVYRARYSLTQTPILLKKAD